MTHSVKSSTVYKGLVTTSEEKVSKAEKRIQITDTETEQTTTQTKCKRYKVQLVFNAMCLIYSKNIFIFELSTGFAPDLMYRKNRKEGQGLENKK